MNTTNGQIIDLAAIFKERERLEKVINDAQIVVENAQINLDGFNDQAVRRTKALIESGATTGNPLEDEIIIAFGLNGPMLEKILAFNARLVSMRGAELFIVFSGSRRTMFGGPGSGEHPVSVQRAYLGILSGERLKVRFVDYHPEVIIPFKEYAEAEGMRLHRVTPKRKDGELTLVGSGSALDFDTSAMAFINAVVCVPSQVGKKACVVVGKNPDGKIPNEAIAECSMLNSEFDVFRNAVSTLTPAEQAMGQHI